MASSILGPAAALSYVHASLVHKLGVDAHRVAFFLSKIGITAFHLLWMHPLFLVQTFPKSLGLEVCLILLSNCTSDELLGYCPDGHPSRPLPCP
jgi:hypothetical protein